MAESKFQRKFYGLDSRQGSAGIRRVSASVKFSFSHFLDFKYILLHVFFPKRCSYGLPVNFQAMLLQPNKKSTKRLREVLSQLYIHLDNTALQSAHDVNHLIFC